MTTRHSNVADTWTPADFGELLNKAIQAKSTAFAATTLHTTDKVKVNFPLWNADPAVSWLAELEEITATDGSTGEVSVTPSKVGGITRLSNEITDDSDPAIADQAAAGLANQIAHAIDTAFLGDGTTGGAAAKTPDGLLSVASQSVDTGASITNLDPFVEAIFAALSVGATVTAWIMAPATAEALSKLKKATGSNEPLLELVKDGMTIAGIPVLTNPNVDAETFAWGIDASRTITVLRKGTEVKRFDAVNVDAIDVRAIARVGFAFLHPESIIRLHDAE
ncbi:phage major capsid protein [uncultured Mycolicibacterium sp.]|uniref:phage major capsid protein n=1 Tax=uncultured Mycolicibacterium sp. TaxID=2320817 RepID=UPI0032B24057